MTSDLNRKAKAGIKALFGRQIAIQVLSFAGGVVLARTLTPAMFGLFTISMTMVTMVAVFGDFGLSASLIQKKAEITDRDIQVGFTLQQILITIVVVFLLTCAPWIARLYPKAPPEAVWLVRALVFNLYLGSWRSMSVIQLERHLEFAKVARIEVIEVVVYQVVSIALALLGFKVWSFVLATIARCIVGTVVAYVTAPWPIKFLYDREVARNILSFGIPMQLNYLFLGMSGWVTPLVGGQIIGPAKLGYVSFGSANGQKPLLIVSSVMRATFPHLARIQDDLAEVERIIVRYITLLSIPTTLWFVLLCSAGEPLVRFIYSAKFVPAVTALTIFSACCIIETFNWVGGMAQEAVGMATIAAKRAFFRTVISAAAIYSMALLMGYNGVAVGAFIVGITTVPWSFVGLPKGLFTRILREEAWLIVPVATGIAVGVGAERLLPGLFLKAFGTAAISAMGYCIPLLLIGPKWLKDMIFSKIGRYLPSQSRDLARLDIGILELEQNEYNTVGPAVEPVHLAEADTD